MYGCISFAGSCPWCCAIVGISRWQAHRSACAKHNTKTQDEGWLQNRPLCTHLRHLALLQIHVPRCAKPNANASNALVTRTKLMSFSWPQTWRRCFFVIFCFQFRILSKTAKYEPFGSRHLFFELVSGCKPQTRPMSAVCWSCLMKVRAHPLITEKMPSYCIHNLIPYVVANINAWGPTSKFEGLVSLWLEKVRIDLGSFLVPSFEID